MKMTSMAGWLGPCGAAGGAWLLTLLLPGLAHADDAALVSLEQSYASEIRPLVKTFCGDCHGPDLAEAEINLVAVATLADARKSPQTWQKVAEMLGSGQMPPPDARQPGETERAKFQEWVKRFLKEEARRLAGDPGPVVLRRLTNAQYTFVLRDLTGTPALSPAREFPVDGAAGEGFTNTGSALVMSPALLTKYLDAAKEVSRHAVLLPDGIRFSPSTTRRDWTEETLAEIRRIYARYSDSQGGTQVNLQGIVFDTNGGGRLPLEKYFAATLVEREAIASGAKSIDTVARERGLSAKYLSGLWKLLAEPSPDHEPSLLVDDIRVRWRNARPEEAGALASGVIRTQQFLWKFNSVGHIGKVGGPRAWMEETQPIAERLEVRRKLEPAPGSQDVTIYLTASDLGDGRDHDIVVWERPRLVAAGRPDLLLRDVRRVTAELTAVRQRLFANAARCLAAAGEAGQSSAKIDVAALARKHVVEPELLSAWLTYLGIGSGEASRIEGHFTRPTEKIAGYDFIQGWSTEELPSLVANSSDQHVRIPGNMFPHSVAVHPTPTQSAVVGWQSPVAGDLRIAAVVQHAHPECGNGVTWAIDLRRGNTRQRLAAGIAQGGKEVPVGPLDKVAVLKGDVVSLVIGPRDGNHSCDLTRVDLTLTSTSDEKLAWNLAADVSANLHAGNPHADRLGNDGVWHFYSELVAGVAGPEIPAGSLLARWQGAKDAAERERLAEELQKLLLGGPAADGTPDAALYRQLSSLGGPLVRAVRIEEGRTHSENSPMSQVAADWGLDPSRFGRHPSDPNAVVDAASLCVQAPATIAVKLPAELVAGYELVTSGSLHSDSGQEGSVQLEVSTAKPDAAPAIRPGLPLIAATGTAAHRRLERSLAEFRSWFPSALCYTKIVPVDEVVTLTLYHREDHELVRLMLSEEEAVKLDRLWDELHYISHDALTLVDAFAQLMEYATQDADPKVFEPLRKPIHDRAAAFRQRVVDTEPRHMAAVLQLAERAYRRPLAETEGMALRNLYHSLRQELPHEEAIRLTLARVLVAPAFLYRSEQAQPGTKATPVSDHELASRLSFFLWSSLPDDELLAAAAGGKLQDTDMLAAQTRRMMQDDRVRRLASEFACQWLHIYDFDAHDEKSPAAFPTFAELRGPMYEEAIRLFTDLVQRDGSILELLETDHTFVNEALAKHYGIDGIAGDEWRKVDGVKQLGRGGILSLAATLSKQSGASRTSPILRGNWVCEVLLGEKLPKPPKGVPVLPETVPAGLTERQLIEQHSSVESCAKCHSRIDPFGFALEGYDAIGRRRTADVRTKVLDGTEIDGLAGLRSYLLTTRRNDFVRQFCKKLLGYSLGRAVQLSDEPLLDEMQANLQANNYRIGVAIEAIVRSPQFRMIRGRDFSQDTEY